MRRQSRRNSLTEAASLPDPPRRTTVLLHGGVTVESGRLFVRPYAAFLAVENGWLTGGATLGLRF